jgi:hypothetical protein
MSNLITTQICRAFEAGEVFKKSNDSTDGVTMFLYGNAIAAHRSNGMWITNAGWATVTTKARLNGLTGVSISQRKGVWYLNGAEWDGDWVFVSEWNESIQQAVAVEQYDTTIEWISTGGYRGYDRPVYAVCGANDTGMWADSPCRSDVATKELNGVSKDLKEMQVPHKEMQTHSSNVFCEHRYLIVPPEFFETAKGIVNHYISMNETRLLYN